jgi:hypothetical protein
MDPWLAAVEANSGSGSLGQKIARNRPDDIQDRCSQTPASRRPSAPAWGTVCENEQVQTRYGSEVPSLGALGA